MRTLRFVFALGLLVALLIGAGPSGAGAKPPSDTPFVQDQIIVGFKPGISAETKAAIHRANNAIVVHEIPQIGVQVLRIPAGQVLAKVEAYNRNPNVEFAEPNFIAYAIYTPNDPNFFKQWGMHNVGQTGGSSDADIDAPEAWNFTQGNAGVMIAILDTGIDQDHEDLAAKIVGNKNFTDSSTVNDLYGHGTHVAGIAAAITDNGVGVAGVGYNSSLMNVKVLNDQGSGYYSWVANGIVWAADNGAKVINMSLGGGAPSKTLEKAVNYAWGQGVVLAAAAGNSDNPSPTYPAKYENSIAVAATDSNDQKASFSSYGSWVDVAAPGVDIYSTFPNHPYTIGKSPNYDYGSGTSMSTPHVAGLAALVWATTYGTSNSTVRARIETTADLIPGTGTYWSHGRINACNAVGGSCSYEGAQPTPTPAPGGSMYVWDIAWNSQQRGPNYQLEVTVTIRWDSNGNNLADSGDETVSDAAVAMTLTYQGGSSWNFSGTTDSAGQVTFKLNKAQPGSYTAQVTALTHANFTWVPGLDKDNPDTFTLR